MEWGLVDAAPETLADVVNGLIEFGLCRQFNETLLHPILVFQRLRKPELVDAKLKNRLESALHRGNKRVHVFDGYKTSGESCRTISPPCISNSKLLVVIECGSGSI